MAGKYAVIVTIIKSISIYVTTSTCKKMGFFFFNAFQPVSVPEECLLDHLYSFSWFLFWWVLWGQK